MSTIIHAILVYLLLLFALRLLARRPSAMLTAFELILLFMIGGMSVQAIIGDDLSFTNVFIGIVTVVMMHGWVAMAKQKWPAFAKLTDGTPVVVYDRGVWDDKMMNQLHIQEEDVMAAARKRGIGTLGEVEYVVVERNGEISIIGKK